MILNHKAIDCDTVDINFPGGGGVKGMGAYSPADFEKKRNSLDV